MEFPHKEQNGVLKYLYSIDPAYFNNKILFSYNYSNYYQSYYPSNAFNFGTGNYWVDTSNANSGQTNFISFCFVNHKVKLKGYEIKTASGETRPHIWSFSGSNDGNVWYNKKEAIHSMQKNELHYEKWSGGIYRCFRYDSLLNSVGTSIYSDVQQIEIFGTLHYLNEPITCECRMRRNTIMYFCLVITLLIK